MKGFYELLRDKNSEIFCEKTNASCMYHFHRQIEILLVLKGEKTCHINNQTILLKEKELLLINSFEPHAFDPGNSEEIVLIIPKKYLKDFDDFLLTKKLKASVLNTTKIFNTIIPIFNELLENTITANYMLDASLNYLLSKIINEIGYEEKKIIGNNELAEEIICYIEANYKTAISLESISSFFGYSKYYFSRVFNEIFKTSLNDYISIIRLENTLKTIKENKCSVLEAAFMNGFNSIQTYYRVAKKLTNK